MLRIIPLRGANYSVETRLGAKMQKESHSQIRSTQVIVELTSCCFVQIGACLRFDDELLINDQIEPLYSELTFLVHDPHGDFASYAVAARPQLPFHRPYI